MLLIGVECCEYMEKNIRKLLNGIETGVEMMQMDFCEKSNGDRL